MKKRKTLKALHNKSKKGRRDQNSLYWAFPSIAGQKLSFLNLLCSNAKGQNPGKLDVGDLKKLNSELVPSRKSGIAKEGRMKSLDPRGPRKRNQLTEDPLRADNQLILELQGMELEKTIKSYVYSFMYAQLK